MPFTKLSYTTFAAAARALAERLDARIILDCTAIAGAARRFVLDDPIQAEIVRGVPGKPHGRRLRLPGALGRQLSDAFHDRVPTTYRIEGHRFKVFSEKRWFKYDTMFERLSGSIYLDGYWQSYRYFDNVADLIRGGIRPTTRPPSVQTAAWLAPHREPANAVCLHVRRGDYLPAAGGPASSVRRFLYDDAINHIRPLPDRTAHIRVLRRYPVVPGKRSTSAGPEDFVDVNGPDEAVDDLQPHGGMPASHHRQLLVELVGGVARRASATGRDRAADLAARIGLAAVELLPPQWIRLPRV